MASQLAQILTNYRQTMPNQGAGLASGVGNFFAQKQATETGAQQKAKSDIKTQSDKLDLFQKEYGGQIAAANTREKWLSAQNSGFLPKEMDYAQREPYLMGLTLNKAGQDMSAAQREFESLTEGLTKEEKDRARRIELGLTPRAVGSSAMTTAQEGMTDVVAESEATIAGRKKFAEMTGASRAKKIDEGFDRIIEIDRGISNIDNAISALDEGASTGPIISKYTPTLRAQTKKLEQVRNMMSLDVLNAATFGALSEKELELVKETALPNLPPDQLKAWLMDRKAAEQKLRAYYQEQIDFLDQGGTVAGFLRMKERQQAGQSGGQQQQATDQTMTQPTTQTTLPPVNEQGWQLMTDAQGNRAYVGPNGEVQEVR